MVSTKHNWYRLLFVSSSPQEMNKEEWIRRLMHMPHGMLVGWVMFGFPIPWLAPPELFLPCVIGGAVLFFGFLAYQAFNDWRKKDGSWRDVDGICWGVVITVVPLGIIWRLL